MKIPSVGDSHRGEFLYSRVKLFEVNRTQTLEAKTQRFFSTFPAGPPGVGLLLLRASLGVAVMVYGALWVSDRSRDPTWLLGLASMVCGTLLLIGFATPIAAAAVSMASVVVGSIRFFAHGESVGMSFIFALSIAASIVLLGPGAFSIDSRLFGRRRIVIPDRTG